MKSLVYTIFGTWILLFALFIPFTYSFFPHVGIDLTNGLSGISEWIARSVFEVDIVASPSTSDSAAQFVQAFLLFILSTPIGILLHKQKRFSVNQVRSFLHTGAAYVLSLYLLKYGVDKLFQHQFYAPEPNTLFTPVGMLSKDILFWSSMGTSSSYNTFMGLIEVTPAFLLLHHKTRMLGGFIALGVLINVLMINIGFDITVKLLSLYLVIVSLFVLSPYFKRLIAFFITDTPTEKPKIRFEMKPKARGVIKTLVIILLFIEVLYGYAKRGSFNGRELEKIEYFGSYLVSEETSNVLGFNNVKRLHIHSKGYLIVENGSGEFVDFPIRIAADHSIILLEMQTRVNVQHTDSIVTFEYVRNGEKYSIETKKYDLNELSANDDSFHWTVDGLVKGAKE